MKVGSPRHGKPVVLYGAAGQMQRRMPVLSFSQRRMALQILLKQSIFQYENTGNWRYTWRTKSITTGNAKGTTITADDKLIFLGDYVDGWSESAQTIAFVMQLLQLLTHVYLLKANHDEWCGRMATGQVGRQ